MTKNSTCNKGKALHISQWIKGELRGSGDSGDGDDDEEDLELWSQERMNAKQIEVLRRLSETTKDRYGTDVVIMDYVTSAETVSVVSSPDDSQVHNTIILSN